jgi:hypothetical protein
MSKVQLTPEQAICGWVVVTPQSLYSQESNPVPFAQEAGRAPEPVWTGAENLATTGIRTPDRPAHTESLRQWHQFQINKSTRVYS